MQILIDIPKHHYENIKSIDSVSLGRIPYKGIIMYSINAIKNGVVQEHGKGHWIDEGIYADGQSYHAFMCSECGWHFIENKSELEDYKYCPFCRADMRGEEV